MNSAPVLSENDEDEGQKSKKDVSLHFVLSLWNLPSNSSVTSWTSCCHFALTVRVHSLAVHARNATEVKSGSAALWLFPLAAFSTART